MVDRRGLRGRTGASPTTTTGRTASARASERPRTVNLWWGQNVETNGFGTHEFIRFCRLLGAKPYLAGNVGSGTLREMRDWVEYCNFTGDSTLARRRAANGSPQPFGVRYWGVGNENWGCGGNFCPEDYAARVPALRDLPPRLRRHASCSSSPAAPTATTGIHADWTRRFLTKLGAFQRIHGFAAHYYCGTAGRRRRSIDRPVVRAARQGDAHRAT